MPDIDVACSSELSFDAEVVTALHIDVDVSESLEIEVEIR